MEKKHIVFFVKSLKGFRVLKHAFELKMNIKEVVIGRDPKVINDYSQKIKSF